MKEDSRRTYPSMFILFLPYLVHAVSSENQKKCNWVRSTSEDMNQWYASDKNITIAEIHIVHSVKQMQKNHQQYCNSFQYLRFLFIHRMINNIMQTFGRICKHTNIIRYRQRSMHRKFHLFWLYVKSALWSIIVNHNEPLWNSFNTSLCTELTKIARGTRYENRRKNGYERSKPSIIAKKKSTHTECFIDEMWFLFLFSDYLLLADAVNHQKHIFIRCLRISPFCSRKRLKICVFLFSRSRSVIADWLRSDSFSWCSGEFTWHRTPAASGCKLFVRRCFFYPLLFIFYYLCVVIFLKFEHSNFSKYLL